MTPTKTVRAKLELPCRELGVPAPSGTIHVRAVRRKDQHIVYLWSNALDAKEMEAWLSGAGAFQRAYGPKRQGATGRTVALLAQELNSRWQRLLSDFQVGLLVFSPTGTASVTLRGSRSQLRAFLEGVEPAPGGDVLRKITETGDEEGERPGAILTQRQEEALLEANRLGYYKVPRERRLKEVAEEMGMSSAALSELLRRAEERLIAHYIASRWGQGPHDGEPEHAPWPVGPAPPLQV